MYYLASVIDLWLFNKFQRFEKSFNNSVVKESLSLTIWHNDYRKWKWRQASNLRPRSQYRNCNFVIDGKTLQKHVIHHSHPPPFPHLLNNRARHVVSNFWEGNNLWDKVLHLVSVAGSEEGRVALRRTSSVITRSTVTLHDFERYARHSFFRSVQSASFAAIFIGRMTHHERLQWSPWWSYDNPII